MSAERPRYSIRPYRPDDRPSVRSICYETGYMGESVDFYYGDRESFADVFTSYYTDHEPENASVIVRKPDGAVVGYLLGCVDTRNAIDPMRIGMRHFFRRGLIFRPSTGRFLLRAMGDLIRDRGAHRTKVDLAKYPAHSHVDLLPEARNGLGVRMMVDFLEHLRAKGVPGVHGEMIAENEAAMAVVKRLGYVELGEPYPLPGLRSKIGARMHGLLIGLDLNKPHWYSKIGVRREHAVESLNVEAVAS